MNPKRKTAYPNPVPERPMAKRLEKVRTRFGVRSRREFWLQLGEKDPELDVVRWKTKDGEESVSYPSVKYYHFDRDAPAAYLARVAAVFGVRLEWLISGTDEMTET